MASVEMRGAAQKPSEGHEPSEILVYTLPLCARCIATIRDLVQHGAIFREVDLSQDAAARLHVQQLGYMRVPVVVAGHHHWAGYNPDAIRRLACGQPRFRARV